MSDPRLLPCPFCRGAATDAYPCAPCCSQGVVPAPPLNGDETESPEYQAWLGCLATLARDQGILLVGPDLVRFNELWSRAGPAARLDPSRPWEVLEQAAAAQVTPLKVPGDVVSVQSGGMGLGAQAWSAPETDLANEGTVRTPDEPGTKVPLDRNVASAEGARRPARPRIHRPRPP